MSTAAVSTSPIVCSVTDPWTWSELLHPLFGIVGLGLAPLFLLGSLEFVGPFEPRGWKLAGTLVPFAYIGWSAWLLALGIGLLITA
jgi:hypothetical protein